MRENYTASWYNNNITERKDAQIQPRLNFTAWCFLKLYIYIYRVYSWKNTVKQPISSLGTVFNRYSNSTTPTRTASFTPKSFHPKIFNSGKSTWSEAKPPIFFWPSKFQNGGNFPPQHVGYRLSNSPVIQLCGTRLHHGRGNLSNLTATLRGNDLLPVFGCVCFSWFNESDMNDVRMFGGRLYEYIGTCAYLNVYVYV